MLHRRFLTLFVIIVTIVLFSACSDDDDSGPTEPGNGDNPPSVSVEPITVPSSMQTAYNNGDPGATQAVVYIQLANSLPSYAQLFNPPEGAAKISSVSSTTGEWTWSEGGATITLLTSETATSYTWTVTINGTYGGKTYNNQIVIEASELKDGSSGELNFYDPDSGTAAISFNWENLTDGTYHLTIQTAQSSASSTIELYSYSDNSGSLDITSSNGSWAIEWASDGSGTWVQYDGQGNITNQGSWG